MIAPGTYSLPSTLHLYAQQYLIGATAKPVISYIGGDAVIEVDADIHLQNIQVQGGAGPDNGTGFGAGINCPVGGSTSRKLTLDDVVVTGNAADGVHAFSCPVVATGSQFTNNASGISNKDNSVIVDRCVFSGNTYAGLIFDGTSGSATNSMFIRNKKYGYDLSAQFSFKFEFNTVVDNPMGLGPSSVSLPNNILARNGTVTTCTDCPGSIISSDVTALHFQSSDTQPYDYHITVGSSAIDAAVGGTLDHDFDGEARPQGAARDVGADEFQ